MYINECNFRDFKMSNTHFFLLLSIPIVFIVAFLLCDKFVFSSIPKNYCVNEFSSNMVPYKRRRRKNTETISTNSSQLNSIKKCIFHCCELDECLFVAQRLSCDLAGLCSFILLKSFEIFVVTKRN